MTHRERTSSCDEQPGMAALPCSIRTFEYATLMVPPMRANAASIETIRLFMYILKL